MKTRTTQDLLAERRDNIQEARRERDKVAVAMLNAHVTVIDAELATRRANVRTTWGVPGQP